MSLPEFVFLACSESGSIMYGAQNFVNTLPECGNRAQKPRNVHAERSSVEETRRAVYALFTPCPSLRVQT
jgi:hypothetical protein